MKGYISVFLLFALALVAHALIKDSSILEEYPGCKSKLVVKVNGFGTDGYESEARILCAEECDKGIEDFKNGRCFDLCGRTGIKRDQLCELCYPDSDSDIDRCQRRMNTAVRRCKRGCRNNRARRVNDDWRVDSTSGTLWVHFRSKIHT